MPQKLAIAISGAVSLGSYEAGVIYEIVEAIAQHNSHPDTLDEQRIEIDVITGASAGAMTACILTQKLMFEAEALRQPHANALYGPWVEDVDIMDLLKLRLPKDDPNFSILSSERIAEIGATYLLQRYATGQPTPRQRHPAAAASIRLGLAMSNLNGVDYAINMTDFPDLNHPSQHNSSQHLPRFTYTQHRDFFTDEITDSDVDDHFNRWQQLEKIARSSGAFPFAFRPLQIDRLGSDPSYSGSTLISQLYSFVYTDGGVFENEPLGLAKDLVDQIDQQHLDHHNRFYLYVAPGAKHSNGNPDIEESNANYLNAGAALAGAIFTQARFQNWITTSQINQKIRQFERQAKELSDVLIRSPQLSTSFSHVANHLLAVLYDQGTPEQQIQADRDRLRQQFTEEYERIVYATHTESIAGEAVATSWLRLVQALEKAQNLGSKDVMTVYAITSEDKELAGEQLFAFGGFLDQSFREFDYSVGRRKAIRFLTKLQALNQHGKSEGQLYLTNFVPGHNLKSFGQDLGNVKLDRVPEATRSAVKSHILDRARRIVDKLEPRFWVRWLLRFSLWIFLSRQLDRLLELKE